MKIIKIKSKIIVALEEELDEDYGLDELKKLNDWDLFVYAYRNGEYDGSGFAVGRVGKKYFYHEMGHCSCDGPLQGLYTSIKALHSLKEIKELAVKNYNYDDFAKKVLDYIQHEK